MKKKKKIKNLLCCTINPICLADGTTQGLEPQPKSRPDHDGWLLRPGPISGPSGSPPPTLTTPAVTELISTASASFHQERTTPQVSSQAQRTPIPSVQMSLEEDSDSSVDLQPNNGMTAIENSYTPYLLASDAPHTSHVPSKIKLKIIQGEYVELSKLFRPDNPQEKDQVLIVKDGQLKFDSTIKKTDIFSFNRFFDCFLVYMTIRGKACPNEFPSMLKHLETVKRLFFQNCDGTLYDKRFRLMRADNPRVPWGCYMAEFVSKRAHMDAKGPSSASHYHHRAPSYKPSNAGRPCMYFNQSKCTRTGCKFTHTCSKCGSPSHGSSKCAKNGGLKA